MTTASKNKASFLAGALTDHTGAGVSFAPFGSPPKKSLVSIIISSTLDEPVFLSIDGSTEHMFVPANVFFQIGFSENKQNVGRLEIPAGTQFFIKQGPDGAPTTGDLFISYIFAG